ncbi:MAG: hypothetical protein NZ930_03095 [Candidatus Bipolaricaulota bacterium]|nr:hypothetical protein [Candidatus Bipolaricaulota bacterium]MDW8030727.1 hypothetical protein [Candidatus Bipolaricaulota bacterium]
MRYLVAVNRSWSAYVNYLILTGIPLVFALPSPARVDALIEPRLDLAPVFLIIATALFAVYSLNFGLAHAQLESAPGEIRLQLLAHVLFLLVVSLPYWTVFTGITGHGVDRLGGALGYLGLYGTCWAFLGVPIGRRWPTEIAQFHVKYALLILALGTTFFVLRPLNPFLMLSLWFGEGALREQVGFLISGYTSLMVVAYVLSRWGIRGGDHALVRGHTR